MKRLLLAIFLALLTACAGLTLSVGVEASTTAPLPVASVQEAVLTTLAAQEGLCSGRQDQPAISLHVLIEGETYGLIVSLVDVDARFILFDGRPGDDTPVWLGHLTPEGKFELRETITFTELQKRYPNACAYLYPEKA